jgi:predicted amidohydrolase YtcJ
MLNSDSWRLGWRGLAARVAFAAAVLPALSATADDDRHCKGREALRLVNGRIHTMDKRHAVVSTVLMRDGKFLAVGRDAREHGECTKTIDLGGRTAVPGIIDNHNHIVLLGLRPGRDTRLENASSIQEVLDTLAARAAEVKPGEWITALGGFNINQFVPPPAAPRYPTLAELDTVTPANPVLLLQGFAGPSATNSLGKAFFASLGVAVADNGGIAAGGDSLVALNALRRLQTLDTMKRGTIDAMNYASSVGVTTHLDQGGFPAVGDNSDILASFDRYRAYDALQALYHERRLTNRIRINFLHLEEDPLTPELQARLLNVFPDFGDGMLRILGIGEFTAGPFFLPGGPSWQNGTRLVAKAGWRNENHSLSDTDFKTIIDGWQTIHDELVSSGSPDGIKKLRWVLAHVPFIDDEYLQKLKGLGGGVSVLGGWRYISGTATGNGPPFRTILNSGIRVGMSSDGMQISPMNPWLGLYYVVTGKNARGELINGGQTLTRAEGLHLYTAANGWFLGEEDKIGTIEDGKYADLIVLSDDYFDQRKVSDERIKDIHAVLTIVNGRIVHDDMERKKRKYWNRDWRREHWRR